MMEYSICLTEHCIQRCSHKYLPSWFKCQRKVFILRARPLTTSINRCHLIFLLPLLKPSSNGAEEMYLLTSGREVLLKGRASDILFGYSETS